jgi:hypothetical protein
MVHFYERVTQEESKDLSAPVVEKGFQQQRLIPPTGKIKERKLKFIASVAKTKNQSFQQGYRKVESFQFDDLETIEHTKCRPLSVTIAVEDKTRKILGFEVSQMPAKGHLARYSVKKYGYRKDERQFGIKKLLSWSHTDKNRPFCTIIKFLQLYHGLKLSLS